MLTFGMRAVDIGVEAINRVCVCSKGVLIRVVDGRYIVLFKARLAVSDSQVVLGAFMGLGTYNESIMGLWSTLVKISQEELITYLLEEPMVAQVDEGWRGISHAGKVCRRRSKHVIVFSWFDFQQEQSKTIKDFSARYRSKRKSRHRHVYEPARPSGRVPHRTF